MKQEIDLNIDKRRGGFIKNTRKRKESRCVNFKNRNSDNFYRFLYKTIQI